MKTTENKKLNTLNWANDIKYSYILHLIFAESNLRILPKPYILQYLHQNVGKIFMTLPLQFIKIISN